MKSSNAVLIAAMGMLCVQAAHAGPAAYVYTPTVEQGEKEIDFKFGTADSDPRKTQATIGFGYGVNAWWFTEAYVKYARTGSGSLKYDAFELENKFQLTETGKYPVDVGFITEIEIPRDSNEGIELKVGPLFQTEFGKLQLNANLLLEKRFDAATASPAEAGYQWQAKYRLQPRFEYGVQGFGSLGKWNDWDAANKQSHTIGPAVFGKVALGDHQAIKYNAAWLFGMSDAAADNTFRLQAELEF
ncbi:MAG: hypothetical protein GZ085_05635 [Sulfuriferula multivorans]|uniref:Transporter n=1 Tax=Sulfuriferula multivorans TaxID=1559896 RepID=A0A7C9P6Z8_9PROT|nr:hypothetical protein [Sulfuriferula multivorans]